MNLSTKIGMKLRQAREALGMTITDVARKTNIDLKYLIAIERGEWDRLPNAIYARAYVKAYAQLVGQNIQMARASRRGPVSNNTQTRFQTHSQYRNQSRVYSNTRATQSTNQTYNTQSFQTTKRRRQIQAEVIDVDPKEEDSKNRTLSRRASELQATESKANERTKTVRSSQTMDSLPSRREKSREKKKRDTNTTIDIWYTRFLIAGGILLALGFGFYMILRFTSTPGIPLA